MQKIINPLLFVFFLVLMIIACENGSFDNDGTTNNETGTGGSMARFTISNDHLYIVDRNSLKSFDISDEHNPEYKDSTYLGFDIETIFPYNNNLFIGTRSGMHIYDITSPSTPEELSITDHFYSCDPVVTDGQYAYVTLNSVNVGCGNSSNLLEIYNIDDLEDPYLETSYTMEGPKGLAVKDDFLFICDDGLKIYDITDIYNIDLIQHINDIITYDVIAHGELLLVVGDHGFYQYHFNGEVATRISEIERLSAP